jgi:hypothetical protein
MKIELKAIKIYQSMSEETTCFEAKLYIDGELVCAVSNRGQGGPEDYSPCKGGLRTMTEVDAKCREASEWLKANRDPVVIGETDNMEHDLDWEVVCQLDDFQILQDFRRAVRSAVLYVDPASNALMEVKFKGCRKIESKHVNHVAQKHPEATILNSLPEADALAKFKECAA